MRIYELPSSFLPASTTCPVTCEPSRIFPRSPNGTSCAIVPEIGCPGLTFLASSVQSRLIGNAVPGGSAWSPPSIAHKRMTATVPVMACLLHQLRILRWQAHNTRLLASDELRARQGWTELTGY